MSIYKRGRTWWLDIQPPIGERIRKSTGTTSKTKAQEYHDRLKAELWEIDKLDKKPERVFEEALVLFLKDSEGQKRFDYKQAHVEYFLDIFAGRLLSSITGEEIEDSLPTHHMKTKKSLANATKNRYRSSIIRVFFLAVLKTWIPKVPHVGRYLEPKTCVRWEPREVIQQLLSNMKLDWVREASMFAVLTGARMSEIFTLTKKNVNFSNKIAHVTDVNAKSGYARPLLLNDEAIALLHSIWNKTKGFYVFTRDSEKRVYDIDRRDFNRACELTGIDDFHFHDLRHTWASWHVQAGTPLFTLKELGGRETLEMVVKYAHLNADHMLEYASNATITSQSNICDTKTKFEANNTNTL